MIEIALAQLRENPVFGIGPEAFRTDALTRRLPSDPGGVISHRAA
jgi:O-antigen ligase